MLRLIRVAITGGLSCGKSSVCRFFQELGAYTVNTDEIVHDLLSVETEAGQDVVDLLGEDILTEGQIDRAKIAEIVFSNKELLASLENLIHPAVTEEIEKRYQRVKEKGNSNIFIAEIPLLFETGSEKFYEITITVLSDPQLCKERYQKQSKRNLDYENRMRRHLDPMEKAKKSKYVIVNNDSLTALSNVVKELYEELNFYLSKR